MSKTKSAGTARMADGSTRLPDSTRGSRIAPGSSSCTRLGRISGQPDQRFDNEQMVDIRPASKPPQSLKAPQARSPSPSANLELKIASAQGSIEIGVLPAIVADPVLMAQLLQNLFSNAIKFKSDTRILVISIAANEADREWVFSVADNGIGIRAEDTERIFKLFQRVHSAVQYPGTGIGLATCKKITDRHGGRLWVESTLDVGTTFFFSMPKP